MDAKKKLFATVFSASNHLQTVGDLFFGEVSTKQWLLIRSVGEHEPDRLCLSKLEESVGSSRQSIKQLALRLERIGFLNITDDPDDGRNSCLERTDACRGFTDSRAADIDGFFEGLFSGIPEEDVDTAIRTIAALEANAKRLHGEYV